MNQHVIQPAAELPGTRSDFAPDQEARNMRSLALQQRANFHRYLRWCREHSEAGQHAAAFHAYQSARKNIADALWFWRRPRNV